MVRPDLNATAEARVKGLVGLRDCVQELIDLQMDAAVPDSAIPVSYTHLDVYKRQEQGISILRTRLIGNFPFFNLKPVQCGIH